MSDSILTAPPHRLAVAASALLFAGLASPAFAQQAGPPRAGESQGMRYLSWAGKPVGTSTDGLRRPGGMQPPQYQPNAQPMAQPASIPAGVRYPGIQGGSSNASRYGVGSHALTPASAWTSPAPPPLPYAAPPAPITSSPQQMGPQQAATFPDPARGQPMLQTQNPAEPDPQAQADYQARMQAQYQDWYQAEAQRQYQAQVQAMPQYQQQAPVRVQAPPVEVQAQAQPQAQPQLQQRADAGPMPAADPMAPRRDAAIFRMQQLQAPTAQPETASPEEDAKAQSAAVPISQPVLTQPVAGYTSGGRAYAGAEPPRESARYYSVHRADGRHPDPIAMPESVYLDGASVDLAEPPPTPVQTRTANGRVQTVVPNSDPSLP